MIGIGMGDAYDYWFVAGRGETEYGNNKWVYAFHL